MGPGTAGSLSTEHVVTEASPDRNASFTYCPYARHVAIYLVRVALTDRPGALGSVASRIGSVRGDVIGVEIVERSGGKAVDEFVVELPEDANVSLLRTEVEEVDGATVVDVRPLPGGRAVGHHHGRRAAFEAAAALVGAAGPQEVLRVLAARTRQELEADWAAVVDAGDGCVMATDGRSPGAGWLTTYAAGVRGGTEDAMADVAASPLGSWDLVLVVGRPGWTFSAGERLLVRALAALADARWAQLARAPDRPADRPAIPN